MFGILIKHYSEDAALIMSVLVKIDIEMLIPTLWQTKMTSDQSYRFWTNDHHLTKNEKANIHPYKTKVSGYGHCHSSAQCLLTPVNKNCLINGLHVGSTIPWHNLLWPKSHRTHWSGSIIFTFCLHWYRMVIHAMKHNATMGVCCQAKFGHSIKHPIKFKFYSLRLHTYWFLF